MVRQQFLEVRLADDQQRRRAVRVGVVRPRHAVEERDVAEPGARLDVGERHLLAGERDRAHPNRAARDTAPFLGRRAARREHRAVLDAPHLRASEDRFAQGRGESRKPRSRFDVRLLVDCKNGAVHGRSLR